MRKYIIEVTSEGIKKTFIDGDKEYTEEWIHLENGVDGTKETCITAQLDQYGKFGETELLELIEQDDLDGLWEYFEEVNDGEIMTCNKDCDNCEGCDDHDY